jgi:chromate reductase
MHPIKILGINGSLRENSSSHIIMQAIQGMIPEHVEFTLFHELITIPPFDGREVDPAPVLDFKNQIKQATHMIICTPEYAFGVPGALKNAIDWTVGSGEFYQKPVALITASSQGEKGHAAMLNILTAISAHGTPDTSLLISSVRSKVKDAQVTDTNTLRELERVVKSLLSSDHTG